MSTISLIIIALLEFCYYFNVNLTKSGSTSLPLAGMFGAFLYLISFVSFYSIITYYLCIFYILCVFYSIHIIFFSIEKLFRRQYRFCTFLISSGEYFLRVIYGFLCLHSRFADYLLHGMILYIQKR